MPADDPLTSGGISNFSRQFRSGALTAEQVTRDYLDRIAELDQRLGAYAHVAADDAIRQAQAIDAMRAAGCDLGPLMGVPIAVKDLIRVDGMPVTGGTKLEVQDLIGPEGPVVLALRRAGCIILGKTKTVEFALGITGVSAPHGTPWNAHDPDTHRLPGGSSSGSAVAMAAGLCGFAIGSDTGGSVRVPAALNGVFGLKTSFGRLSNDGAFPLAAHLDSIGLLTRDARDAEIILSVLTGEAPAPKRPISALRIGRPSTYFFDGIEPSAAQRVEQAIDLLSRHGASIEPVDIPEAPEREDYFPAVLPVCLVASLGRERANEGLSLMDPVIAKRVKTAFDVDAIRLVQLEARRSASMHAVHGRIAGFDAWISPTVGDVASPVSALEDPEKGFELALGMTRNTQPANYLDLSAVSIPLPRDVGQMPFGLQLMAGPGREFELIAIAQSIENALEEGMGI
ncbi:amidase [Roseovarius sp. S4756]|uniref:amidase n=1 Tax=Roseovarius maritimus TaxID=3342637 RepID=UPI0037265B18